MPSPFPRSLVYLGPTISDSPTSIFNQFHKNNVSAQETHGVYKFDTFYIQTTAFSEGNFYLCVESIVRVSDPFFLHIKS